MEKRSIIETEVLPKITNTDFNVENFLNKQD